MKRTSLYLVTPFYKEVCVLSNVWDYFKAIISLKVQFKVTSKVSLIYIFRFPYKCCECKMTFQINGIVFCCF